MADPKDVRIAERKILRCTARVVLKNATQVKGRTIDISATGISIMLDDQIATPQQCVIGFEAPAGNKIVKVSVSSRAVYCTCVGTSGFRVGFQFDQGDENAMKAIRQLLQ